METVVSMLQEDAVAPATAPPHPKIQALLVPAAASLRDPGGL